MLVNLEGPPLKSLLCEMGGATDAGQCTGTTPEVFTLWDGWSNWCWSMYGDHPWSLYSMRWVEQLMLVNARGPPLKSLLCEMGGTTDAGQPRAGVFNLFSSTYLWSIHDPWYVPPSREKYSFRKYNTALPLYIIYCHCIYMGLAHSPLCVGIN